MVKIEGTSNDVASPAVKAGGLIFVSAVTGTSADGKVVGPDIASQTKQAIERLSGVLNAAGSSLAQAVSVNVYLKRASDFEGLNAAYRQSFADKPPVRTTVVTDLGPDRLIALSAVAVPAGAARETLHPAGWVKSPRPYSYIVRAGGLVFLSGLVSRRGTDDTAVPGSVSLQTKTILDNAGVLLKTAGLSYSDVVAARVYLTDDSLFEQMNDTYRTYFMEEPPARATAVTELMGADSFVEITLIASESGKQVLGPAVSPSLPLSTAVRAGDLLFLSGVLGNTEANASDLAAQTREVFTRIRRTLDGAGVSFSHVVDNIVYLNDMWQQRHVDGVSREVFPHDPPARTIVGARLVARSALVEMMMTAAGR
ncbi:MAG TPA: RidA family protein [Vicinamibacterales bacterium]|nr:RidA family protein [Vicinamibacterales bacterium]